jgi:hypothetical protein
MSDKASVSDDRGLRVEGRVPLIPALAEQIDEAPELMSALATEFAPMAAGLATQQAYWLAINAWFTDRLTGPVLAGAVTIEGLRRDAWAIFASSYWGAVESQKNWGVPASMSRLGFKMEPPFTELQRGVADSLALRIAALRAGDDECLRLVRSLMQDGAGMGMVRSLGYNAGMVVVLTEEPPLGERSPQRKAMQSPVRINARDFLRVDYDLPIPQYLRDWRLRFENAVLADSDAYEEILTGGPDGTDLRAIWAEAVPFGHVTRGGGAADAWTDDYYDDAVHWTAVVNFGLEALNLAAMVAVIARDPEVAKLAVMTNFLHDSMGSGWLMGFQDVGGHLPTITDA